MHDQYESMKAWVEYIRRVDATEGWQEWMHVGDWLALDNPRGGVDQARGGTDEGYIGYVYYAYSAQLVAQVAEILGNSDDALKYKTLSNDIRTKIKEEYFSPTGRCCINTQTALILALRHGLTPDVEKTKKALKNKFKESGGKLKTGFVGTPLLCPVLSENAMSKKAYDLLLNEEYPGWLFSVNLGATTIWERWNSVEANGLMSSTGMNSLNHYAYGSIVEWLFRYAAGLKPVEDTPGFRHVLLQPEPDFRLGYLDTVYDSPAGTYRVHWKFENKNTLSLFIEIPFNCTAELKLPYEPEVLPDNHSLPMRNTNGYYLLEAGNYTITYSVEIPQDILSADNKMQDLMSDAYAKRVLIQHIPGILSVPDSMYHKSLRELLTAFRGENAEREIQLVDADLKER